ncbi:MAG: hypothetical protein K0U74_04305 [Alphaproteobacteria bacterium]|nr:hypothetical protein [Alphaproteobacteria bacterium]
MRPIECVETIFATLMTGLAAILLIFLTPGPLAAKDGGHSASVLRQSHLTPVAPNRSMNRSSAYRLNESDRAAALESVHFALMELGDGASYVWHRGNGKLSGVIQPTSSFVDPMGKVCRHIEVLFSAGERSKKTEAIACRQSDGIWRFDE